MRRTHRPRPTGRGEWTKPPDTWCFWAGICLLIARANSTSTSTYNGFTVRTGQHTPPTMATYKEQHDYETRKMEATKMRKKYPTRLPVSPGPARPPGRSARLVALYTEFQRVRQVTPHTPSRPTPLPTPPPPRPSPPPYTTAPFRPCQPPPKPAGPIVNARAGPISHLPSPRGCCVFDLCSLLFAIELTPPTPTTPSCPRCARASR